MKRKGAQKPTNPLISAIVYILKLLTKSCLFLLGFFGLWAPALYAIFGVILFFVFKFNPFTLELDSVLYMAGFGATCVCALIITIRHILVSPSKRKNNQQKHRLFAKADEPPVYKPKHKFVFTEQTNDEQKPPKHRKRAPEMWEYSNPNHDITTAAKPLEHPYIYYSAREKDTLIHEYSDRFEVYKVIDGSAVLDKVEYKHNEK